MNRSQGPPKFIFRILRSFCKEWYVEAIEGDVWELYARDTQANARWATLRATINTLRFFRWRFLRNAEDFTPKSSIGMYKNYFKVSIRNMRKHPAQTLLNILGLSIGMTSCLLIAMHVNEQLKYDKHFTDYASIYRVTLNERGPYTPARLVKQMREDFPEIATGTRTSGLFESVIELNGIYVRQDGGILGDSTFFEVFPARFLEGDPKTALTGTNEVVITQQVAQKLFPDQKCMGRIIRSDGENYIVKAVVENPRATTTLPYKYIVSMPREQWAINGWWTGNNFFSYLKLRDEADPALLEAKIPSFVEKYIWPEISESNPAFGSFQEYIEAGNKHFFKLVPLSEIHLHHPRLTLGLPGSYQDVLVFSILSFFILSIASINYVNMSTARSSLRAKEIGMRKVLGSVKSLLIKQFLFESLLVAGFALVTGVIFALALMPYFNWISNTSYGIEDLLNVKNGTWFLILFLVTGILAGAYPAIYLASLKPISALKGERVRGSREWLRSYLVVLQFAISITMISGTFIIYRQIKLMVDRNLGVQADQVLVLRDGMKVSDRYQALKHELLSSANIRNAGMSNSYPSSFLADWNYYSKDFAVKIAPYNIFVTDEIGDVWGLELMDGRFFDPLLASDSMNVVVNRSLVDEMGWSDPIGETIVRGEEEIYRVVGVVNDFATGSAKRKNESVIFRYVPAERIGHDFGGDFIMIRIAGNVREALEHVEAIWEKFLPGYPMEATFMDDSFERLYESEKRFGSLFIGFSVIAILLACIGLFALAAFTMDRRKKEVALRKIMGARIPEIFAMVCRDFGLLLALGALLALPAVYYFGKQWLEDYADRIEIGFLLLFAPLAMVGGIAFLTISYHTYRAAAKNPVHALKEE